MRSCAPWLLCVLVACAACRSDARRGHGHAPVATLIGRVRLANDRPLPAYTPLDMARTLLHGGTPRDVPADCAAANAAALQPVALGAERTLSNVVIAASDFTRVPERDPVTHAVTISGCRLQPPMLAAMAGDGLTIQNRDAFAFEPLLGPAYRANPLAPGRKVLLPLSAGVESIRCSTRAPCGRSDVVVFYHPVFATSDAHGDFRIERFPAAELVRVTAWHPLFEESQTFVWLEPGTTNSVEFVLIPKLRFEAGAAADSPAIAAPALSAPVQSSDGRR
jgi:hypothetical protein